MFLAVSIRYADGPRYYTEAKLMSFNITQLSHPAVQSGGVDAAAFSAEELLAIHLASIEHQLEQFYAAAAVAVALGRVLVMPQFQCFCYRDPDSGQRGPATWIRVGSGAGAWSCRAPGDDVSTLPFNCTLDQVGRALTPKCIELGGRVVVLGQGYLSYKSFV